MPRCAFCGNEIEKGLVKMYVYTSGKIIHFCSKKCEKNLLILKRKPLETRWTESYRREHKKGEPRKVSKDEDDKEQDNEEKGGEQ